MDWQLQEAKSKFSELMRRTLEDGPQTITRHGRDAVVMVSDEEYRRLIGTKPDFKEFLMGAPGGLELIDTSLTEIPGGDYPREPELGVDLEDSKIEGPEPEGSEPGISGPGKPLRDSSAS